MKTIETEARAFMESLNTPDPTPPKDMSQSNMYYVEPKEDKMSKLREILDLPEPIPENNTLELLRLFCSWISNVNHKVDVLSKRIDLIDEQVERLEKKEKHKALVGKRDGGLY
jgi:hypothetical protein